MLDSLSAKAPPPPPEASGAQIKDLFLQGWVHRTGPFCEAKFFAILIRRQKIAYFVGELLFIVRSTFHSRSATIGVK